MRASPRNFALVGVEHDGSARDTVKPIRIPNSISNLNPIGTTIDPVSQNLLLSRKRHHNGTLGDPYSVIAGLHMIIVVCSSKFGFSGTKID